MSALGTQRILGRWSAIGLLIAVIGAAASWSEAPATATVIKPAPPAGLRLVGALPALVRRDASLTPDQFSFATGVRLAPPGTWDTGVAAQNLGPTPARIQVQYYNDRGELAAVEDGSADPGYASVFFQGGNRNLVAGRYSAAVFADQPVSIVVSETNYGAGMADFYNGSRTGAGQVSLPLVFRNAASVGWYSLIAIQNVDDAPTTITARFFRAGEAAPTLERAADIAPGAALSWDLSAEPFGPLGTFIGSAVISSPKPIVAVVNNVTSGQPGILATYRGIVSGDVRFQLPLLYRHVNGWSSGIQTQNVGPQPATVRATYLRSNAPGGPWVEEKSLPPGSADTFYLPASPGVPDGFVGSATLESLNGQPLAVLVNNINYAASSGSAYNAQAPTSATIRAAAPLLFKNAGGWTSGLQVQNLSPNQLNVRVTYFRQGGGVFVEQRAIAPNAATTFFLPAKADLPDGFVGSALIDSQGGAISVIANHTNYDRGVSGAYNAENY